MTGTDRSEGSSVSILMVGFNSRSFIQAALSSVPAAAQRTAYEIRFVDNGTDLSEDVVRADFPQVKVLPSRGNIGFGAGNNYLASEAEGDWLLLLNPDTTLKPNAIDLLLDAAHSDCKYGILGGLSVSPEGKPLAMSVLEFPTLKTILRGAIGKGVAAIPPSSAAGIVEVEAVSGGFMLINRETWEKLGGFDERFYLYAEELDLCQRLRQLNGKVGFLPAARLVHDVGSGDAKSFRRVLLSLKGAATYYRKHYSPGYARACLLAHWLSCAGRFFVGSLLSPFDSRRGAVARSMCEATLKPWLWFGGYDRKPKAKTSGLVRAK